MRCYIKYYIILKRCFKFIFIIVIMHTMQRGVRSQRIRYVTVKQIFSHFFVSHSNIKFALIACPCHKYLVAFTYTLCTNAVEKGAEKSRSNMMHIPSIEVNGKALDAVMLICWKKYFQFTCSLNHARILCIYKCCQVRMYGM